MPTKKETKKKRKVTKQKQKQRQSQNVIVNIHKGAAKSSNKQSVNKQSAISKPSFQPIQPISYSYPIYNSSIPITKQIIATPIEEPKGQTIGPILNKIPEQKQIPNLTEGLFVPLPILQKRGRRTKQQMDEARQMEREDIGSYNLSSAVYNFIKPEVFDDVSEISTTPLYEGGRETIEPKSKRQYVKSGKYSKRKTD